MKKLKIFAKTFWRSLTSPSYYMDILSAKFSFSLKYLYFLLFISSLLLGAKGAIGIARSIPKIPGFIENTKTVLSQIYPKELVLTVKDKNISTNVVEPYFIAIPREMRIPKGEARYLLAIDTSAVITDFEKYQSFFLLSKEFVAMKDENSGYKVQPLGEILKDVPDGMTIKKGDFNALVARLNPYYHYIYPVAYAGIIFLLTLWPLFVAGLKLIHPYSPVSLIILLFYSLFLFSLAKLLRRALTYKNVYRMSMHGLTVFVVTSTFMMLINFNLPYIPLLAFLLWMIVVVVKQEHVTSKSA